MMNYLRSICLATLIITGGAQAAENGDIGAGKDLSVACAACHGQDGATGLDGTYPNLAGQNAKYLKSQMAMIQSGSRPILLMAGQLDGKSETDLANIAAYFASLPPKVRQAEGDDAQISKASQIYRGGIARKGVAACSACHNPNGLGNEFAGFPRIAGQPAPYTAVQLKAYRERIRATDEDYGSMMRDIAEGLTDTEIAALADYIQGLN
ncbi:MAG: cytochrome c553 [Limisphaerales bacterium]|jgi:cytochrome c553